MLSANDQRLRATQMAQDGIHRLSTPASHSSAWPKLMPPRRCRWYWNTDIEDAQDLVVSLHMMLDTYEETQHHGPASI